MKKMIFVIIIIFVSLILIAEDTNPDETNRILYDGWVTGPGSPNKYTQLLPFGYTLENSDSSQPIYHFDEHPLLYETDMGWPVPDEDETQLKYLFFGDTYFFMKDSDGNITTKITDENGTLLDFDVTNSAGEIAKQQNAFSPQGGQHLKSILTRMYNTCLQANNCFIGEVLDESCTENCINEIANKNNQHATCLHDCLDAYPEAEESCKLYCNYKLLNKTNYSECFSYCNDSNSILNALDIFDYMNFDPYDKEKRCENFCKFDMVETYASAGYFLYDGNDSINLFGFSYNNGTSNIFLAAEIYNIEGSGNESQYKISFPNRQPYGSNLRSPQIYSTTDSNKRKSKSIWMNAYERDFISNPFVGIYPRGYFYACAGSPSDGCTSKKLFVPYSVTSWDFLTPTTFCQNAFNRSHIVIPGGEVTELELSAGDELKNELERQKQSLGVGIYDFEDECRVKFSQDSGIPNLLFPYSFPSCDTTGVDNECYHEPAYPNRNILWPNLSRMSNMTVIHDISKDILSIDNDEEYPAGYIYFMGTGETEVYTDRFNINCQKSEDPFGNITYNGAANPLHGYGYEDLKKTTQKAYIARVPAYESEIKCAASYEYFTGITNGIAKWSKNMEDATPLYGFYPLQVMEAESIVRHRDLYWMTARLNETSQKGFVVLASPDAFHWQKVDTILLDKPEAIWRNYAFFWLPPKLIQEGDNTMPFLYSIWKNYLDPNSNFLRYNLSGFLESDLNPQFTRYNLKSGKYKFMENEKTHAFLLNTAIYDSLLTNTIPGKLPTPIYTSPFSIFYNDTVALPFTTFQNLYNLNFADSTEDEDKLRKRYVIIEYCHCGDLDKKDCTNSETGPCKPFKRFVTENGNGDDNWKIIDLKEDEFFNEYVSPCKRGYENIPDYMCNIPFEHGTTLPKGIRKTPVWNWRNQITKDLERTTFVNSANVILRFSHWRDLEFEHDNYPAINKQLMENNKLIPYDCDGTDSPAIIATCQDPSSWRTTKMLRLRYRTPFDFIRLINPDLIRLEYLYPYPVMINDFGKPGDPVPDIWDMLTADHFAKEFFKVASFEYADSVPQYLAFGAAATAIIKNGTMTIYAWGGSFMPQRDVSLAGLLYVGTFDPETEVVTFNLQLLDETDPNSPALTAGTSMVYDDKNDRIYLIGAVDQNGISRIYRLTDAQSGKKWESVTTIDLGRYFRLVKKSEHEYFAFGGETGTNTFTRKAYLLDLNNMASPQALQDIPTSGLANSFAAYSEMDQKLYVFGGLDENGASDRFLSYDIKTNTWSPINVAGGPGAGYGGVILVDYITETISLGGGVFVNNEDRNFKWIFNPKDMTWSKELKSGSYCLKESDSAIQGGIETSGTCVSFTHPFYNSFSAGTTVYSVAGKGTRLYAGTNDSIKIYDISDPNSPVLVSSFSTNNARVNDLEIEGEVLFAATSKGLYKLEASDPDELDQILFVSTGSTSQNEIELYDGKVYVGDNDGIKIRDKETLSLLLSANSGQVYDFAIENGEIAMFRSSFWNSGIQFRNAETLVETAYDYTSCNDVEVESFNGKLYLACDNYTYSFEANNGYIYFTQLSGDKRDLRENYTYNGYTYTPDGNYIRLSTNEEVPAICGNGIVEGDEVCDGTPIDCTELDENYVSGIAACNSTCDGYVLDNCTAGGGDGW